MITTCRKCGAEIPGGTLLAHELAAHPKVAVPERKPRTCYRAACVEFYGPKGHVVGLEGPHVH